MPKPKNVIFAPTGLSAYADTAKGEVAVALINKAGKPIATMLVKPEGAVELFNAIGEAIATITGSRDHFSGRGLGKIVEHPPPPDTAPREPNRAYCSDCKFVGPVRDGAFAANEDAQRHAAETGHDTWIEEP